MNSIPDIGGQQNIPQQPPEQPKTDLNQLDAINTFTDLIQQLTSLASEAKLGGKSHG